MEMGSAKCRCQHCDQNIEFEAMQAGSSVHCPGCQMETVLFIPRISPPPPIQARRKKMIPTVWGLAIAALVLIPILFLLHSLGTDSKDIAGGLVVTVFMLLGIVAGAAVYFVPAIIAFNRKKKNANAIFVLNLCLGWTFIGWVVALVWACTVDA